MFDPNKAPVPSQSLINAAMLVFAARAAVDVIRPEVEKIQSDILLNHVFTFVNRIALIGSARFFNLSSEPQRLTSFSDAPNMSAGEQKRLFDILEGEYVKAGFTKDRLVGHCPLLQCESSLSRAVQFFIEVSQELNPLFDVKKLDYVAEEKRAEFIELTLKYVGCFLKPNAAQEFLSKKAAAYKFEVSLA